MNLEAITLVSVLANFAITFVLYCKLVKKSEEELLDEAVEREMEKDKMNEGFENIMSFAVGAMVDDNR